jgi:hypothetical protein
MKKANTPQIANAGSEEEPRPDGAPDRDHLQLPGLQPVLEPGLLVAEVLRDVLGRGVAVVVAGSGHISTLERDVRPLHVRDVGRGRRAWSGRVPRSRGYLRETTDDAQRNTRARRGRRG